MTRSESTDLCNQILPIIATIQVQNDFVTALQPDDALKQMVPK